MNFAGFFYDYTNKQEQGFTGTAVFLQNSGPVRVWGFDADASFRLSDDFRLRGAATWVPEAKYTDFPNAASYGRTRNPDGSFASVLFDATGYRLPRAPEFSGNVALDYEHYTAGGIIDGNVTVSYTSSQFHDLYHVVEQPDYTIVNARFGYTFGDHMRLGIYGRNLTNETYISNTAVSGLGFFAAYGRPREVGLQLGYSY